MITTVPLTDIITGYIDNRGKSVPTSENGIPLIATNCIKEIGLYPVKEKLRYVSQEIYETWFRGHPKPFDIIIVNKGTPGLVCFVPDPVSFCIAQDMIALQIDESKVNKKYLFAYMRSKAFKNQVSSLVVGTTIPHLKKTDFNLLNIPLPEVSVQKFIGEIYYNIMNKIELNQTMNQTLEEMAMTLYKHWFVDFGPFQDGEFVEAELGRIPEGWKVVNVEYFANVIGGGTPKTSVDEYWNGDIPWVSVKDLNSTMIVETEKRITKLGLEKSSTKMLSKYSTILSARGTIGNISMISTEMCMNQSCYALKSEQNFDCFTYLAVKSSIDNLISRSHGSVFSTITKSTLQSLRFTFNNEIVGNFEQIVRQLFALIHTNILTNINLIETRDYLLPRLLSGEIDVTKAEKQIEEIL